MTEKAILPSVWRGMCTVVSGGVINSDTGISTAPMTDMSSGTRNPDRLNA
jgi:hypothetical protein